MVGPHQIPTVPVRMAAELLELPGPETIEWMARKAGGKVRSGRGFTLQHRVIPGSLLIRLVADSPGAERVRQLARALDDTLAESVATARRGPVDLDALRARLEESMTSIDDAERAAHRLLVTVGLLHATVPTVYFGSRPFDRVVTHVRAVLALVIHGAPR